MEDFNEGATSKFNAGILQMGRIDKLQTLLNMVRLNPLALNEDYGVYNYEAMISCSTSLILEAGDKLDKKEVEKGMKLKQALEYALKKYPIHEIKKSKVYPYKQTVKLNEKNWRTLMKYIFDYESMSRNLLDIHGFSSPTMDDEGL